MRIVIDIDEKAEEQDELNYIMKLLVENGVPFINIHAIHCSIEEYMKSIFERRDFKSECDVTFNFSDDVLRANIPHFVESWLSGLSPYKALTFLAFTEANISKFID